MTRTFQIVKPFPELNVLENVMIGAFNKTGSTKHAKEIALDVLELVEFSDQAKMSAGALPVAGRKRIEVAKALATQPELLLLDEVLAGLTPTEMQKMIAVLGKVRDAGITIVIVEHVMAVIMSLCDHIVVINNGENIASGNPQEISVNPAVMEAYLGSDFNAQSVKLKVSMLELRQVTSGYEDIEIVKGLSLKLDGGSITTIIGSNGVGKTTTIRTIAGLNKTWSGKFFLGTALSRS